MTAVWIAVTAVGLVALSAVAATVVRRRRTPHELRGEWWSAFERDLLVYTALRRRPVEPRHRTVRGRTPERRAPFGPGEGRIDG